MSLPSGLKIPLVIDASMIIGGIITLTIMWSDIRDIKADRQNITDGRLVRLEEQNKSQDEQINELKRQVQLLWQRKREP